MDLQKYLDNTSPIEKSILNYISRSGHTSKSNIEKIINMKHATLSRVVDSFIENGLVIHDHKGKSSGGRRPKLLSVNPEAFYLIGIDMSRTHIRVIIADACLNIIDTKEFGIFKAITPEEVLEISCTLITQLLENNLINISKVIRIGIGTVGKIDKEKGIIIDADNFGAVWNNFPICDILNNRFGTKVVLENGANAATFAEYSLGSAREYNNILFVNIGIGIRCGIICDGHMITGINNFDSSYSHIIIEADGKKCTCGNYGCLKAYSSIKPIIDEYSKKCKVINPGSLINIKDIRISDILEYAENGDKNAIDVLTVAASYMGIGLANLINILNPEIIILGGLLIEKGQLYYDKAIESAKSRIYKYNERSITFSKSFFEKESISLGICAIMIDNLLS